ncbi:MAG: tetratricopeptide repeat protein [Planctomycetes bacterium]|nr:tetratricopeptide repeat protein [Planctomycetota bacterium]
MDGRKSLWLLCLPCALLFTGCLNRNGPKNVVAPSSTHLTQIEETPKIVKKTDGPKRNPKAGTEIAFGRMKEMEAESENIKKQPELQARLRDDARHAYQQALKLDPNNLNAYRHLGQLYTKIGDHARAQETLRAAMAKHPREASLWYDLGLSHQRKRELPESVKCFSKAVELDPENREYTKKLGFTLAWMGNVDQGLAYLTRSLGSALAHYHLAQLLEKKDQRDLAREHCRLALQENQGLQRARDLLEELERPTATPVRRGAMSGPAANQ